LLVIPEGNLRLPLPLSVLLLVIPEGNLRLPSPLPLSVLLFVIPEGNLLLPSPLPLSVLLLVIPKGNLLLRVPIAMGPTTLTRPHTGPLLSTPQNLKNPSIPNKRNDITYKNRWHTSFPQPAIIKTVKKKGSSAAAAGALPFCTSVRHSGRSPESPYQLLNHLRQWKRFRILYFDLTHLDADT
jgi:hypothetical protein